MISAELPLSTRILLVLNPSMFNIITNGSLWGCFTPLASASLKEMSWSVRLCLKGGTVWTLFTCLWHDFLRDLNDSLETGPPEIVFISPMISLGGWCGRSSFLGENSRWPLLPPRSYCNPPSSRISVTFPFVSTLLSALLGPGSPPCNGRDPCESGSTYSYREHRVTNEKALAI